MEYFSLSSKELVALEQLHSIKSRIYFILKLGYFKARNLFFIFSLEDVSEDARYIIEHYFPNFQFVDFEITKVTRLKQQGLILKLCNYRNCNTEERQKLKTKARKAAMICSKPIYIFREIMHYLREERIVIPGYTFLQDTVGKALTYEQNLSHILKNSSRLISIVRHHLTSSDIEALKSLLSDSQGLYEITLLKRAREASPKATNEVNFAILHLFGYQFAPRYKDIRDKVSDSLYGFKHPSQYGDVLLKPIRKIKDKLIIEEWDNIQRIMVSLALKTTTYLIRKTQATVKI